MTPMSDALILVCSPLIAKPKIKGIRIHVPNSEKLIKIVWTVKLDDHQRTAPASQIRLLKKIGVVRRPTLILK